MQPQTTEDNRILQQKEETMTINNTHITSPDPAQEMTFAQISGEAFGYDRVSWHQVDNEPRIYSPFIHPMIKRYAVCRRPFDAEPPTMRKDPYDTNP